MPVKTKSRKGKRSPKATRPHMPGYGVPTYAKGLLPWKWPEQRLAKSHNYWLITTRPNGAPHAMPVWGVWVDSVFVFSTGRESRKAKNLAANPKCVVCNELSKEAVTLAGGRSSWFVLEQSSQCTRRNSRTRRPSGYLKLKGQGPKAKSSVFLFVAQTLHRIELSRACSRKRSEQDSHQR